MTKPDTDAEALDPKALESALDDPYAEIHRTTVVKAIRRYLTALSEQPAPDHVAVPPSNAELVERLRNIDRRRGPLTEQIIRDAIAALSRAPEPVAVTKAMVDTAFDKWIHSRLKQLSVKSALRAALEAALTTPPAPQQGDIPAASWRTMDTAPKDGTWIWLYVPGHGEVRARWGGACWSSIGGKMVIKATHWMPRSASPAASQGGE